jgi:hypothetical protein
MSQLYLGIDPKVSGAIALLDALARSAKTCLCAGEPMDEAQEVDASDLVRLLKRWVKWLMPPWSRWDRCRVKVCARSSRQVFATASTVLSCLGLPSELILPARWKHLVDLPADKATTLASARPRWPTAELSRVRDQGQAEALYLADLARKRFGTAYYCSDQARSSKWRNL